MGLNTCSTLGLFGGENNNSDSSKKELPYKAKDLNSKNPKVVVVGGGWSGFHLQNILREFVPTADVILVEKRELFFSCPVSNAWMFDMVDMRVFNHRFIDAANNHGVTIYLQDRSK